MRSPLAFSLCRVRRRRLGPLLFRVLHSYARANLRWRSIDRVRAWRFRFHFSRPRQASNTHTRNFGGGPRLRLEQTASEGRPYQAKKCELVGASRELNSIPPGILGWNSGVLGGASPIPP